MQFRSANRVEERQLEQLEKGTYTKIAEGLNLQKNETMERRFFTRERLLFVYCTWQQKGQSPERLWNPNIRASLGIFSEDNVSLSFIRQSLTAFSERFPLYSYFMCPNTFLEVGQILPKRPLKIINHPSHSSRYDTFLVHLIILFLLHELCSIQTMETSQKLLINKTNCFVLYTQSAKLLPAAEKKTNRIT